MKVVYFNIKTFYGVETIDEIRREEFETAKEFKKELKSMIKNHIESNGNIYTSQRCDKTWKK